MVVKVYTINAFAKANEGGNPAGVVLDADNLTENQMKKIAKKVGFSETAFVMKSNNADFKVRFFTPKDEVDLCGHATIATFSVLNKIGIIKSGRYTQETKAGILLVEVNDEGLVMMNQKKPEFYQVIDYKEIADTLNISIYDLNMIFPCQIVSTGIKDIFIPIRNIEVLNSINPDFEKIKKLSEKYNAVGYHLFTINGFSDANAYCRNFAPLYDIDEEAATGTSSGALASYLFKYKIIESNNCDNISFKQGYTMDRPSQIKVSLSIKNKSIDEVKVGGKAKNMKKMEISINN